MESPFSKTNIITMFLEPVLDPISQNYIEVITLSDMPSGPISKMVKIFSPKRLSEFQNYPINCSFILLRYPSLYCSINMNTYMFVNDIPSIFSYLISNGYTIEQGFTKIIQRGGFDTFISNTFFSGNRRTICMFSYPCI
jgi:hypothetical protein